jgi:hypothetical protein
MSFARRAADSSILGRRGVCRLNANPFFAKSVRVLNGGVRTESRRMCMHAKQEAAHAMSESPIKQQTHEHNHSVDLTSVE